MNLQKLLYCANKSFTSLNKPTSTYNIFIFIIDNYKLDKSLYSYFNYSALSYEKLIKFIDISFQKYNNKNIKYFTYPNSDGDIYTKTNNTAKQHTNTTRYTKSKDIIIIDPLQLKVFTYKNSYNIVFE